DRVDDRVLADGHQALGIVPIAALLGRLQVRRLEAVDVGEDAVLVRQRSGVAHQRIRFCPTCFCASMTMPTPSARMIATLRSLSSRPITRIAMITPMMRPIIIPLPFAGEGGARSAQPSGRVRGQRASSTPPHPPRCAR